MKKLYQILLFSVPFVLYMSMIIVLDPFSYFGKSGAIPFSVKKKISPIINECLWKIIEFDNKPYTAVLLGDSRMAAVNQDTVKKNYRRDVYNMSYSSASLQEMIYTFWYISTRVKLDTVYMSLSLEKYSQTFVRDRVQGAISVQSNPLLYFSNYNVIQASYYCLDEIYADTVVDLDKTDKTKDSFWKYQLDVSGRKYYSSYRYSKHYYSELDRISDYCEKNGIKLIFVIFPVHKDLQDLVKYYQLEAENDTFIHDLTLFGDVFDFCFPNKITVDKQNYKDPFHIRRDIFYKYYLPELFKPEGIESDSLTRYYPRIQPAGGIAGL